MKLIAAVGLFVAMLGGALFLRHDWRNPQQALDASIRNMKQNYTPNIQAPQPPRFSMPSVPGVSR